MRNPTESRNELVKRLFSDRPGEIRRAATEKLEASGDCDIARASLELAALAPTHVSQADVLRVVQAIPEVDSPIRIDAIDPATRAAIAVTTEGYSSSTTAMLLSNLIYTGTWRTLEPIPAELQTVSSRTLVKYAQAAEGGTEHAFRSYQLWSEAQDPTISRDRALRLLYGETAMVSGAALRSSALTAEDLGDYVESTRIRDRINSKAEGVIYNDNCPPALADAVAMEIGFNRLQDVSAARVSGDYLLTSITEALFNHVDKIAVELALRNTMLRDAHLQELLSYPAVQESRRCREAICSNSSLAASRANAEVAHELAEFPSSSGKARHRSSIIYMAGHPDLRLDLRIAVMRLPAARLGQTNDGVHWAALQRLKLDNGLLLAVQRRGPVTPPEHVDIRILEWLEAGNLLHSVDYGSLSTAAPRLAAWAATTPANSVMTVPHRAQTMVLQAREAIQVHGARLPAEDDVTGWRQISTAANAATQAWNAASALDIDRGLG